MSDQIPRMLLDVDGVLNAHGPYADIYHKFKRRFNPHWDCQMSSGQARSQDRDWTIWWAQPMVDRLAKLRHEGLVEITWCSTWNSDAAEIENLLGLPPLRTAFPTAGVHHRDIARMKRSAAAGVLAAGRRLIWVDDSEVPYAWELAHAVMAENERALLIRPKVALGLMPGDLDLIEQFCQQSAPTVKEVTE